MSRLDGLMLFLLNEDLIDLGDPLATLRACGVGEPRRAPSLSSLTVHGQEAAFAGRGLGAAHPDVRRALAALFALTGRLNCALFVCPQRAVSAREVAVRYALAPLTTLAFLHAAQQSGRLNAALINHHVWRLASQAPAA
jgi:hypothetical protein